MNICCIQCMYLELIWQLWLHLKYHCLHQNCLDFYCGGIYELKISIYSLLILWCSYSTVKIELFKKSYRNEELCYWPEIQSSHFASLTPQQTTGSPERTSQGQGWSCNLPLNTLCWIFLGLIPGTQEQSESLEQVKTMKIHTQLGPHHFWRAEHEVLHLQYPLLQHLRGITSELFWFLSEQHQHCAHTPKADIVPIFKCPALLH